MAPAPSVPLKVGTQSVATTNDEGERAFMQQRLALFAKWAFVLAISTDALDLVLGGLSNDFAAGWYLDRLVSLLLVAAWLTARSGKRSLRFLRALDASLALALALCVGFMGRYIANGLVVQVLADHGAARQAIGIEAEILDAHSTMLIMMGGSVTFAFRAAVIPSAPRRTFFITGVLGMPFALVPIFFSPAADGMPALRPEIVWGAATGHIVWWVIITATCTAISAVIYGLRKDVRDARRLGQYTLVEKIGEGGMGAVYRARHARLRRRTAIKLLPPEQLSEDAIARFESEVQLTAELTHPNTVTVFDYGRTEGGVFYYAMEYLDGASLAEVVAVDGDQPAGRVVRILTQTASALQEAHDVGLIHRDIKPANIMLTKQGNDHDAVKLLDFGLAKALAHGEDTVGTRDDRLVGTPLYMAPEVIRDANARSAAGDIYSLGAVAYFLLTGTDVFAANTIVEVCAHHLHTAPTPLSERTDRKIPPELAALVLACLAKDPSERPASASELVARLSAIELEEPWTDADAVRWWETHRGALEQARRSPEPLDDVRITVAQREHRRPTGPPSPSSDIPTER